MRTPIERDRVREFLDHGAQLVEVPPAEEYAYEHLPAHEEILMLRLTTLPNEPVCD